jgi:hypothetical protein
LGRAETQKRTHYLFFRTLIGPKRYRYDQGENK